MSDVETTPRPSADGIIVWTSKFSSNDPETATISLEYYFKPDAVGPLRKLWLDRELVYPGTQSLTFRFYPTQGDRVHDPLMADVGDLAPMFKGYPLLVIENLPVVRFNYRIPRAWAEIDPAPQVRCHLEICARRCRNLPGCVKPRGPMTYWVETGADVWPRWLDRLCSSAMDYFRAEPARIIHRSQRKAALLETALANLVYEVTHLSAQNDDGSHNCRISAEAIRLAREAIASQ